MNFELRFNAARRQTLVALCAGLALSCASVAHAAPSLYGPVAAGAVKGGTLSFGSLVEPPGLDPFHQAADARIKFTVLVYQGLFYEGADGTAEPLLADSYEVSNDGLVYTVKLKHGVKFHNGATMTAKDVAYSYN